MTIECRAMTMADYDEVYALWQVTEDMAEGRSDSREQIAHYLERNPGISSVAYDGDALVGVILGGHDGRRGSIWRLAVAKSHRRNGVGTLLANRSVEKLREAGVLGVFLFVYKHNDGGRAFWERMGWKPGGKATPMWRSIEAPDEQGQR